ncbi:MAG TPA: glycoside hydrolase family 3 N-terminal domain-containing protein [Candidatus Limnocylindrales bacterium]|nr:glycoside hydrolase family 3 N-terminal domain-containing protein [Candidatus Limnocylindrales bacterium]
MLSRRGFLAGAIAGLVAMAIAACSAAIRSVGPSANPSVPPTPSQAPSPAITPAPSDLGPTLRERIGAMLVVGFRGRTPAEADVTLRQIASLSLGGVVLFDRDQLTGGPRNVESPDQLAALVRSLKEASTVAPLTVAIDQEGGMVARLDETYGFPPSRSAAELGRLNDPAVTEADARAMAEVLVAAGITLNLAPVVDLAVNPTNPIIAAVDRSYGADPALVIAQAAAFVEAHHALGVACTLKHFPGHGSSTADTHLGVVDVTDTWADVELEPFSALVERGLADAVLTAHVFNAHLDPDHPATLSKPIVTGILRERIGFDGAVLSDDMQMRAISDAYGYDEAVALAIEAGIDLLVVANQIIYEPDVALRTIEIIERLVRDGRITEARIEESWRRISALKGA